MKKRPPPPPQHHQEAFLQHHWATFTRLNCRLVFLYRAIEDYSRYCDPFLGAIFPYYITVQCYIIYIIVFIPDFPPLQVAIMYVAFLECNLFLFATTHECAVIVRYSGGLVRLNRRFAFELNRKLIVEKNFPSVISQSKLVKAEGFLASRRLHRYAFTVFANFRITSKMYYMVNKKS